MVGRPSCWGFNRLFGQALFETGFSGWSGPGLENLRDSDDLATTPCIHESPGPLIGVDDPNSLKQHLDYGKHIAAGHGDREQRVTEVDVQLGTVGDAASTDAAVANDAQAQQILVALCHDTRNLNASL